MNIIIDYDLESAIKDINEDYSPIKLVRNQKQNWTKYSLPALIFLEYLMNKDDFIKALPEAISFFLFFSFTFDLIIYKSFGDIYKYKAENRLKILVYLLNKININTSVELIKKSNCYHKVTNLRINGKNIPQLLESKYILLPNYNYNGDIVDCSLLQEHVIGSKQYVLSLGRPVEVLKPAYLRL